MVLCFLVWERGLKSRVRFPNRYALGRNPFASWPAGFVQCLYTLKRKPDSSLGPCHEDTDPFMKANNITLEVRLATREFAKDDSKTNSNRLQTQIIMK